MSAETKTETKTRTSITITPSLYDAAKVRARAESLSFSAFVEHCISEYLAGAPAVVAAPVAVPEAVEATVPTEA